MSRPITFSYYLNKTHKKTQLITKSWEDWVPILTTHKQKGSPSDTNDEAALNKAKNGPALILGTASEGRSIEDIQEIHALGIDIDDTPDKKLDKISTKLEPFEYVVYTTHKHGSKIAKYPKIRFILPLDTPFPAKDFSAVWKALEALTEGAIDPTTKNINRLYYLPTTFDLSQARTRHNKGRWITLEDLPLDAPAPDSEDLEEFIKEDEQFQILQKIEGSLKGLKTNNPLKEPALSLAKGESFAKQPNRHQTILKLTIYLARKFPQLPINILKIVFQPSLKVMSSQPDPPTMQEVVDAFTGARDKLKQNVQQDRHVKVYSSHDLQRIAQRQDCSIEELEHRWIVQKDGGGWVLDESGNYRGYYPYRDFPLAIRKYLAGAPVDLFELTNNGRKRKNNEELVATYGDIAKRIVSDLSAQYTTYDPKTCTLIEAVSPLRDLEPVFNPQIDHWLRLLFSANPEKGLNWVAAAPDLTKQNCAIYFVGPKDSGKSIFAEGLCKLWSDGGPGDIGLVLNEFNEEFVRCPLIFADESIPKKYARQEVTAKLRAMLSTTARSLRRLYTPPSVLKGAIRLLLAANNTSLLNTDEIHTPEDQAAIAQRFMYVKTERAASQYLATLPREVTAEWIEHGIAEHALWLQQNRVIEKPGNRFVVEGDIAEMHRLLTVSSHWTSLICEWLVRYLMKPNTIDSTGKGLILRKEGSLWVNNQVFVESWDIHLGKSRERPDSRKIGHAVNTLAKSTELVQMRFGPHRHRYKEIDIEHLIHWAKEYNIGNDEEAIREMIGKEVAETTEIEEEDRSERDTFDYN